MKELLSKIREINARVQNVEKGGENKFAKYSYVRLGDILCPIRPLLAEYGLVITQSTQPIDNHIETHDGKYYSVSSCTCTTTVYETQSGQSLSVESVGFAMDSKGDKACYKAITGARKYGITELFNLDWDAVEPEDDRYDDNRHNTVKTQQVSNTTQQTQVRKGIGR